MPRSFNAQLAVDLYEEFAGQFGWDASTAWHGIARLLLTCNVWDQGIWKPFHGVVVYRERNDFRVSGQGANAVIRRAQTLTAYLAQQLDIPESELCENIGLYWRHPTVARLQPNNLVGHAFRSIVVHALAKFGDAGITYTEEVNPYEEFPGHHFSTRSRRPKIDIIGRRGSVTVAILSSRWRYRHDRVDLVDEALAYAPAARRQNPNCHLYAVVGEFAPDRLEKVLDHCPPAQTSGALTACVHFAPELIQSGLGENGRVAHLRSFEWLINQTFEW